MMKVLPTYVALFLFATLAPCLVLAQSVQRESIGTLGASAYSPGSYYYDCAGQPYHTLSQGTETHTLPGFVQPFVRTSRLPSADLKVSTYPNPVSTVVHVAWDDASVATTVVVYNLQGIALQTHTLHNASSLPMNLSDHPAGMYIVEVRQQHQANRIAIIKN